MRTGNWVVESKFDSNEGKEHEESEHSGVGESIELVRNTRDLGNPLAAPATAVFLVFLTLPAGVSSTFRCRLTVWQLFQMRRWRALSTCGSCARAIWICCCTKRRKCGSLLWTGSSAHPLVWRAASWHCRR